MKIKCYINENVIYEPAEMHDGSGEGNKIVVDYTKSRTTCRILYGRYSGSSDGEGSGSGYRNGAGNLNGTGSGGGSYRIGNLKGSGSGEGGDAEN